MVVVVGIEGGDVVVIDVGVSNGSAVAGITVEPQARLYVPMPGCGVKVERLVAAAQGVIPPVDANDEDVDSAMTRFMGLPLSPFTTALDDIPHARFLAFQRTFRPRRPRPGWTP